MIDELKKEADVLLIVPPFGSLEIQALAAHTLQACSRDIGFSFNISYLNLHFAQYTGADYAEFCKMNYFLLGERMFAKTAWGNKVGNQINDDIHKFTDIYKRDKNPVWFYPDKDEVSLKSLRSVEKKAIKWIRDIEKSIKDLKYKFVGITSSFEQNNAAIALFKIIKKHNPNIVTFIGGFNCEKDLALGIESFDKNRELIDFIFSGESEESFKNFLINSKKRDLPSNRIIESVPLKDLNQIPNLDYSEYFEQLERWLPHIFNNKDSLYLAMESSRGCWWGEKYQCSFCGTSDRVKFRPKKTKRIIEELNSAKKWGIKSVHMADLIMPDKHLTKLLPELIKNNEEWKFYFEQKVSLNLKQLKLLKKAGVIDIQPGIESLSTTLLKKMKKGTSLKQNLRFLRDGTFIGINIHWNIIWGIPGEKNIEYKKMNDLIPMITHFSPPVGLFHMTLVKFSPYFRNPESFGINDIEPIPSYYHTYPKGTDIEKIAIIHKCNYPRETIEDTTEIERLMINIRKWNKIWESDRTKPVLKVCKNGDGKVILLDTRGLSLPVATELDEEKISLLMDKEIFTGEDYQKWAIDSKVAIVENNEILSLAMVDEEIRNEYGNKNQ